MEPHPVPMRLPDEMVDRQAEWDQLERFATSEEDAASLGIVWGRRRVGKSFLLESLVEQTRGFYYGAVRGSSAEALRELGERVGAYQGTAAPLAFYDWDAAIGALMALGRERETVVVLDEYAYLLEHTPELDSLVQRAFGPRRITRTSSRARLILCGSAISVMSKLLSGTSPLRGRASLDLRISPFDFRVAAELHGIDDLKTAFRTYAVIGGVAAYAREMSGNDVPAGPGDFDRWVCQRVLSPGAPLLNEVALLLSEDPATAKARKINLYHAALAGVATGRHAHGKLTRYVRIPGASLAPIIAALESAELIERVQDPIRDNRPTYHPSDPLIRFHYAVIRRHHSQLSRHGAATGRVWKHVLPTFDSHVVGPCFEAAARYWTTHFADPDTVGGHPDHVGPTTLLLEGGAESQLDVVVAADDADTAPERTILAIGEARAGERITQRHLRRLEAARSALGRRASGAKLLLFGVEHAAGLKKAEGNRTDVALIDLDRLYRGS
jgi:uncharacterized protein